MANQGNLSIGQAPHYEDEASLKKWIRSRQDLWITKDLKMWRFIRNQTGTAEAVEIEEKGGQTIAQIGKTELTVFLAGDADNASTNTNTYAFTYKDSAGVDHTVAGTGTATLNGTPVAFVPAVTDYYCSVSFTGPEDANVNVYVATTAIAAIYATITKGGAVAATEDQLLGVGAIYGRMETNSNDSDGMILDLDYITPWGEVVEAALCTINTTDGTTEIRFYKADTLTTVKDFYRCRYLEGNQIPTTNTHTAQITNLDNSAIYNVIEELCIKSLHSRYMVPLNRDSWLSHICVNQAIATNLDVYMTISYTPYGDTIATTCKIAVPNNNLFGVPVMLRLAALSEISFTVLGNHSDNSFDFHILEAAQM